MSHLMSSGLLAASMLLGQAGEPAGSAKTVVPPPPTMQPTQATQRPVLGWFNREDRPILHKIQGWFKRDQTESSIPPPRAAIRETTPPMLIPAPTPTTAPMTDFPRKLPNPSSQRQTPRESIAKEKAPAVGSDLQLASVQPAVTPKNAKTPILAQNASKIGRDEKFEWITGQIEVENGNHVLYYASPETIDKYHGRIALAPQQADLSKFRHGDLVSVRGQIALRGMIPIYRVSSATLIERPK